LLGLGKRPISDGELPTVDADAHALRRRQAALNREQHTRRRHIANQLTHRRHLLLRRRRVRFRRSGTIKTQKSHASCSYSGGSFHAVISALYPSVKPPAPKSTPPEKKSP